jgi:hypothetical protein
MQKSFTAKLLLTGLLTLCLALTTTLFGQGVTSSGITGTLIDSTGSTVAAATVTVVHVPTNTTYTAITGANGRFKVTGLRVGGPYTVSATAPGLTVQTVNNVEAPLGDSTDVVLMAKKEDVVTLEKFSVTSSRADLDANTTGAGNVLSGRGIANQPTSNRSFADLMKTNPFVTIRAFPQVQALGMNNRYNSITLDGARLNDQFGLASSGLLSLKNPFSLDAIEQISMSLTPYDVGQSGFAGASVNVVSKSGTNEFHGSAYYIYTAYKWQGRDVSGSNIDKRPAKFFERTWGATLGGPIIKDRLFFFLNYEKYMNPSGGPTTAGFTPDTAFLSFVDAQIKTLPGSPNLGTWGTAGSALDTDIKRLAKLDWNITKDHRLSVRYSDTKGSRPSFGSFNPGTGFTTGVVVPGAGTTGYTNGITSLPSSYYQLSILEKVWATQLFSNWSPDFKTQFTFSKNDSTSLRTTPVNFPEIRIFNVPGTSSTGATISTADAFSFGTEVSSMGNGVIIHNKSYGGFAEYSWKDIVFKAGFDREESNFDNLFRNGSYGVFQYNYSPTLSLLNDKPLGFYRGVASAGFPGTDVSKLEQTGYFAQAKWEPNQRLNVTFGLRYDALGSPIAPGYNAAFSTAFNSLYPGVRNNGTIDGTSRLAPRLSFNYSVDKERNTQVRGGLGVFLGRNPWVWVSNSYGNAGFGRFAVTNPTATAPTLGQYLAGTFTDPDAAYKFSVASPMGTTSTTPTASSSVAINFIEPGLKLPTNMRGNIAVDHKLRGINATFTVEYIYNKALEAMFYDNINLKVLNGDAQNKPTATSYGADGRLRFATNGSGNGGPGNAPLVAGYGNVLRLRNVEAGESHYVAFVLDRPFKDGWAYNIAYTRGRATEAQPLGSSTAGSGWGFINVFNRDAVELARSDYEVKNRVQATLSREFNFLKRFKTTVALAYEGRSGQPFSYVYGGDLNKDGTSNNDLVAVPTGLSDARFDFTGMTATAQQSYLAFMGSSGLGAFAGGYAPRNAFFTPWQNRLDLHVSQEIKTVGPVKIELFADFINFGSWFSKGMFNYVEELNTSTTNSSQQRVLGAATYTATGQIKPTATLNADNTINFASSSLILPNNGDSRWRIQAGASIKF